MTALQLLLGIGALVGIAVAVKLLIWYPALFEINFRNVHGTRCISYVLAAAEILALIELFYNYEGKNEAAAYGIAFIVLTAIIVFVNRKSKKYSFDFTTKLMFLAAQLLSPISLLVTAYLLGRLQSRITEFIFGKDDEK